MCRKYISQKYIEKLPTSSGIYFLYQNHILVYIGKAYNLLERVHIHLGSKDFDEIGYETTHWDRARKYEKELLEDYKKHHGQYPYYNRQS